MGLLKAGLGFQRIGRCERTHMLKHIKRLGYSFHFSNQRFGEALAHNSGLLVLGHDVTLRVVMCPVEVF